MKWIYQFMFVAVLAFIGGCHGCQYDGIRTTYSICIDNVVFLFTYPGGGFDIKSGMQLAGYGCSTYTQVTRGNASDYYNILNPRNRFFIPSFRDRIFPFDGYPPKRILGLPFPAIPSEADPLNSGDCDPRWPDILQLNTSTARLFRTSTCPHAMRASIPLAPRPSQLAVTPDGNTAVVTSFDNAVNFIDLTTNRVAFTLPTGLDNPSGVAISPDGSKAYVTSFNGSSSSVLVINIATHTITSRIPLASYPQSIFLNPEGSQGWVTFPVGTGVSVLDLMSGTSVTNINVSSAYSMAFNSTGTRAYIASQAASPGSVLEVNASTYEIMNTYKVGAGPLDIAMTYGDGSVLVTNTLDNSISAINLSLGTVTTTKTPGVPRGLTIVQ